MRTLRSGFGLIPIVIAMLCSCTDSASDEQLAVGVALPFTGANAQRGVNIERALLTAVDEINEAGGVSGRQLGLESVDTHSTVYEGTEAVKPLLSRRDLSAVIGPDSNDLALGLAPLAYQADKLLVTPSATPREVALGTNERSTWLRLNPSASQLAQELANRLIADDMKHVLIVHVVDSFAVGLNALIIHHLVQDSASRVPFSVALPADRFPDNTAVLETLERSASDPYDAIVVVAYPTKAASIVNDVVLSYAPARRKKTKWYFAHIARSPEFLEHALTDYIDGAVGVTLAADDDASAFRERFRERWFGEDPSDEAYYYVDALNLMALATAAVGPVENRAIPAATLSATIRALTTPGGEEIHWNQLARGFSALEQGKTITYRGLTGSLELSGDDFQRKAVNTSLWRIENGQYVTFVP